MRPRFTGRFYSPARSSPCTYDLSIEADARQPTHPTRLALVGCGPWGTKILRDLRALGCEVHVAARSDGSKLNAENGGAASIVTAIEELPEVDGVVVARATSEHAQAIDEVAARHRGPIYCEKPLCADVGDAERLAADYADRLFVMDKWRYHPGVLEIARIARNGELGAVQSLHMRRVSTGNPHADVDTVMTHAPHDLSITLEILSELPAVAFATEERTAAARVGINATLGGPPWVTIEVSDCAPGHRRELRMVCEGGSVQLDGGWAESITVRRNGAAEDEVRPTAGELPLLAELQAFVEHLHGGPAPKSSVADAALQVRRLEEMGEAATR